MTLPIVDHSGAPKQIVVGSAAGIVNALQNKPGDSYLIRIASGADLAGRSFAAEHAVQRLSFPGKIPRLRLARAGRRFRSAPVRIWKCRRASEEVETPAFEYRAICLFPYADSQIKDRLRMDSMFPYALMQVTKDRIDWAAKNRLNYVHPAVNEAGPKLWEKVHSREQIVPEIVKRGLGLHYGGHSYFAWLPPDKYFAAHPDYYAAIQDGKPQSLNVANPEVAEVMAKNIGEFLDRNPEISIVTVWMNDAPAICTTPGCLKMEGTASPQHQQFARRVSADDQFFKCGALKFTNAVARRLRKTHPKVIVNHLAYNELIDAPTDVAPEPNVLVAFAPIQRAPFRIGALAGYFRPLSDPEQCHQPHLSG